MCSNIYPGKPSIQTFYSYVQPQVGSVHLDIRYLHNPNACIHAVHDKNKNIWGISFNTSSFYEAVPGHYSPAWMNPLVHTTYFTGQLFFSQGSVIQPSFQTRKYQLCICCCCAAEAEEIIFFAMTMSEQHPQNAVVSSLSRIQK
jgi:hypothetical protein